MLFRERLGAGEALALVVSVNLVASDLALVWANAPKFGEGEGRGGWRKRLMTCSNNRICDQELGDDADAG